MILDTHINTNSKQMVFVTGMKRSGTSWVRDLLNAHPDIYCRPEDSMLELIKSLRSSLTRYGRTIFSRMRQSYITDQDVFIPDAHDLQYIYRQFFYAQVARHCDGRGGTPVKLVGFRDHDVSDNLPLFAGLFPEASFIYILRDSREMAVSQWYNARRIYGEGEKLMGNLQHHARIATREWVRHYNSLFHLNTIKKIRWHMIRYEDLCEDFTQTTRGIYDFLGVPSPDALLNKAQKATDFETLTGRTPGSSDVEAHLRSGITDSWKEKLEPRTLEIISAIAGRYIRMHNYEDTGLLLRRSRQLQLLAQQATPPPAIATRLESLIDKNAKDYKVKGDTPAPMLSHDDWPSSAVRDRYRNLVERSDGRMKERQQEKDDHSPDLDDLDPTPIRARLRGKKKRKSTALEEKGKR